MNTVKKKMIYYTVKATIVFHFLTSSYTSSLLYIFVCEQRYKSDGHDTVILAGAEYGSGSSRDWAAKGPMLLVRSLL